MSGDGVQPLLYDLQAAADAARKASEVTEEDDVPVISITEEPTDRWEVTQKKNKIFVTGAKIERFGMRTDFESEDAVRRLRDIMRKMGIMQHIEKLDLPDENIRIYIGDNHVDWIDY